MIEHERPKPYPHTHLTAVAVPTDFARVIAEAATKAGVLFEDQLLTWAQQGAECSRLHKSRE